MDSCSYETEKAIYKYIYVGQRGQNKSTAGFPEQEIYKQMVKEG